MSTREIVRRSRMRIRNDISRDILRQVQRNCNYKGASGSEIIEMCLSGDERAWSEFINRYEVRLFRFLSKRLSDSERAKDLVQDTFVRVFLYLPNYDRGKTFSTWIYTIALNLAKNEFRDRKRNPLISLNRFSHSFTLSDDLTAVSKERNPEQQLLDNERMEIILELIETLPEHHRQILHWRYVLGMTYRQMANEAGVVRGTIKSRLSHA